MSLQNTKYKTTYGRLSAGRTCPSKAILYHDRTVVQSKKSYRVTW